MIKYELFARNFGDNVRKGLVLRVGPSIHAVKSFEKFNEPHFYNFKAYSLQCASLMNGNIMEQELEVSSSPAFTAKGFFLDAFLDISSPEFGAGHLFQGFFLSGLEVKKKNPFYLATLNTEMKEIGVIGEDGTTCASVPFSDAYPYGQLLSFQARHATEIQQKLLEQIPLLQRQVKNARERYDVLPESNAYLVIGENIEGKSGMYEKSPVLVGHYVGA